MLQDHDHTTSNAPNKNGTSPPPKKNVLCELPLAQLGRQLLLEPVGPREAGGGQWASELVESPGARLDEVRREGLEGERADAPFIAGARGPKVVRRVPAVRVSFHTGEEWLGQIRRAIKTLLTIDFGHLRCAGCA